MHRFSPRRLALVGFLVASCLLLGGNTAVFSSEWQGKTETKDGIEYVTNPKAPMEEPVTVTLEELWRVGGDSEAEGEFFGVITQVATDPAGNVYLLDQQLNEVKVFSPEGDYLRTIGREGEGPGEFRQPADMFFLPDGNLGVLQLAPGRIVMLSTEGEPMGDYPLPADEGGASRTLVSGHAMGDNLLLVVSENKLQEGRVDITRALTLIDSKGVELKRLLQSTRTLEFVNFLFDETAWRTFDNRWVVAPAGGLFAVEQFLNYEIAVWDNGGNRKRVISREYDHWSRSDEQKQEWHDIFDALLQNQLPQYTIKVSEYDPDITNLYPQPDGSLWILSSHGTWERPDGSLGVFDVFDADGHFARQVTLMGEGEPLQDGYFFRSGRVFVVTDLLEANIASRGGRRGAGEGEEVEPEPITVICYKLDATAAKM